jgi:undecaprenyl-diphosphatase
MPDESHAANPGSLSTTPTPNQQPSPEARAEAETEKEALREALRQIQTPEQAHQIVEAALKYAQGTTEGDIRELESEHPAQTRRVQQAAEKLGVEDTARLLLEAAREVASTSGETREALEQAFQEATNPQQADEEPDPALQRPLDLLRQELLTHMRPLQALDARLFLAINQLPHPRPLNQFMYDLTVVMSGGWGWVMGLMVAALVDGKRGRAALHGIVPPLWFATMTVEYPIKFYFRRRRPFIDIVQSISVGRKPGTFSFPSGHSASAFAAAWLLRRHYPELAGAWYSLALLVGFSRMYVGAHYPGDVLSGAIAGTVLAEATRWMIEAADENGVRHRS